ncbi:hypothetical protein QYE77_05735 [Thermanaerothrix sp. 4228-RoL]|jgi:hypothetical protein|uniref:Uncharacterized protein n=1 Tax=Thermanaerothrix solaris TaxID=3058434 RepID=A0ABU3NLP6_9CHLR|nr:hypothetical protein [Thermanaerothrix sp. 4228-RoL]MDT8897761.1 hypothetical protein [Thermanaerothrix sp. 4228-RoL]
MVTQFDEKGKFFTRVITKRPVNVVIQTPTHRIYGQVHVRPDERLKDELDQTGAFLAVTEATIYDTTGEQIVLRTHFLALQVQQIVWITPLEELMPSPEAGED